MRAIASAIAGRAGIVLCVQLFAFTGCYEEDLPGFDLRSERGRDEPGGGDHLREPCLMAHLFTVGDDDSLTYVCGHSVEVHRTLSALTGRCANAPDARPGFSARVEVDGFVGSAELFAGQDVVERFDFEREFLVEGGSSVLAHEAEDGARVELHVVSRTECYTPPQTPISRAQLEALKR